MQILANDRLETNLRTRPHSSRIPALTKNVKQKELFSEHGAHSRVGLAFLYGRAFTPQQASLRPTVNFTSSISLPKPALRFFPAKNIESMHLRTRVKLLAPLAGDFDS